MISTIKLRMLLSDFGAVIAWIEVTHQAGDQPCRIRLLSVIADKTKHRITAQICGALFVSVMAAAEREAQKRGFCRREDLT